MGRDAFAGVLGGLIAALRAIPPAPGFDEVLVRNEDGRFLTEWKFGNDPDPHEAARPMLTPNRRQV